MLEFNLSFDWFCFIIALVFTVMPFYWLKKAKSKLLKFYYIGIVVLIFVYSGAGSGWEDTPASYLPKYCIYMCVLGLVCYLTLGKKQIRTVSVSRLDERYAMTLERLINKYGNIVILFYVGIPLVQLALAGKIHNIISPPALSLQEALEASGTASHGLIDSLLYYIKQLVMPFYFVSLYKYKDRIGLLSIALLAPLYFAYAGSGYLSRSGILPFLIIIYIAYYLRYPERRKLIIRFTIIGMPAALFVLSWFTFARLGRDIDISYGDAISLLAYQETSYPVQYAEIQKWPFDGTLLYSYIDWLVKLPFPGFLKSSALDYEFNAIFTEKLTGASRTDMYFSISLPGLVGESVFFFGKYFYWIHALIVGWVISMAYKLAHHKQELFLVLFFTIYAGVSFARAGTVSTLPFYFKHLIIYLIVVYLFTRPKRRQRVIPAQHGTQEVTSTDLQDSTI